MTILIAKLSVFVLLIKTLSIEMFDFVEDSNLIAEKGYVTFVNLFM